MSDDIKVSFTKEEANVAVIQLITRKDYLDNLLVEEAKQKNVKRIRELSKFIDNLQMAIDKMVNAGADIELL